MSIYVFPDVEAVILDWIRGRTEVDGVSFGVELPVDLDEHLPFVLFTRVSGGFRLTGSVIDEARIDIDVRAETRESAHDTMQIVLALLDIAYTQQFTGAIIYRVDVDSAPGWVPDPVTNQPRWISTVTAYSRPS